MKVISPPPQRKLVQKRSRFAAPIGGLNYISNFMDFPATDAHMLDNLIPKTNGVEIRKGWAHWITPANDFVGEVRSLMVFNGDRVDQSKLFASESSTGHLYDVTTAEQPPIDVLAPTTNSVRPGEWYDTHFHTEAGNFLCIVSAGAGYFVYSTATGWVDKSDLVTFPDSHTAKDICFIWTWKSRIWFLIKDSSVAYYLPLTSIQGAATAFDFGQQLTRGGPMSFGATWTYDAGSGIDDSLVLVSEQGELLIYQGTDPSNATNFSLKGLWFIGQVPVGRRGYCAHGGDLLILCTYGLVGMADIVAGRVSTAGESIASGIGFKVNQELAARISDQIGDYYWHLTVYPSEAIIVLGTPIYSPSLSTYLELAMNSITNAWCTMTGMDILCATIWQGQFIFGTHDGGVKWGFHGFQDNTDIANIQNGDDITGRFQNSFNDFDSPNDNKRMQRIKVYGLLERTIPTFYARFQPEYAIGDDISAPSLVATSVPFWDRAKWDEATWSIGAGSFRQWFGVNGFGKKMSLQLALRGAGKVLMTDYEVLYETGIGL